MKYGHRLQTTITAYDKKGRGTAEMEVAPGIHRTAAIPFTAIGDAVEAVFTRRDRGIRLCQLDQVLDPGPDRILPPCPHAGHCGGCIWQHVDYPAQLKEKEQGIQKAFKEFPMQNGIKPIRSATQKFGYRNRMDFAVGWKGEIGLKEYGAWNRYVDIRTCLLTEPGTDAILDQVREWMREQELQPWDAKKHAGDIRYVVIRDGRRTRQRMVILIVSDIKKINGSARKNLSHRLQSLKEKPATSILLGEQPEITDISTAKRIVPLAGDPWIQETINGLSYRIYPNGFFQTNTEMAEQLQKIVLEYAEKTSGALLDLYCGSGFFGIAAAAMLPQIKTVYGYELDKDAIRCAKENAEQNQVTEKCHFTAEKAEDRGWKNIDAETVILDPPRSGLHPKTIKALLDPESACRPKRIIYVSCNYHQLAEELPRFLDAFRIMELQPLDLFPQTRHAEVVLVLDRQHQAPSTKH